MIQRFKTGRPRSRQPLRTNPWVEAAENYPQKAHNQLMDISIQIHAAGFSSPYVPSPSVPVFPPTPLPPYIL